MASYETYQEAMKRAFDIKSDIHEDYTAASDTGNFLNGNAYMKLLNNNMDPEVLTKQVARSGPEGVKFLMNFLSKQCNRFKDSLQSIISISEQIDVLSATNKLFQVLMQVSNAAYGTIYYAKNNQFEVYHSNWRTHQMLDPQKIIASNIILKGDPVNILNFRTSEYFKDAQFSDYQTIEPTCILSEPFVGDGMKVVGIIELIGKREHNPVFTVEEEFLLKSFASLTTIVFSQVAIKNTADKKSSDIKTFLTKANAATGNAGAAGLTDMIISTARELVNADRCALFLLDKEKGELWSKIAQGSAEIRFPVTKGIAGYVVTRGEACSIVDGIVFSKLAYEDDRFNKDFDKRNNYRTKTILCVPMMDTRGEVIGAVQAINKQPDGYIFTSEDSSQLTSFAALGSPKFDISCFYVTKKRRNFVNE
jgi:hypothetical protein